MSDILPRQLPASVHGAVREELARLATPADPENEPEQQWRLTMRVVIDLYAAVLWHEKREAHVIDVLRQAERCGGGYGFARQLLGYLGAQEGQE